MALRKGILGVQQTFAKQQYSTDYHHNSTFPRLHRIGNGATGAVDFFGATPKTFRGPSQKFGDGRNVANPLCRKCLCAVCLLVVHLKGHMLYYCKHFTVLKRHLQYMIVYITLIPIIYFLLQSSVKFASLFHCYVEVILFVMKYLIILLRYLFFFFLELYTILKLIPTIVKWSKPYI